MTSPSPDQQIDAFAAVAVATFDQNVARTKRQYFTGLDFHLLLVARK